MNIKYESLDLPISAAEVDAFKKQLFDSVDDKNTKEFDIKSTIIAIEAVAIIASVVLTCFHMFIPAIFLLVFGFMLNYGFKYFEKQVRIYAKIDRFAKDNGLIFKTETDNPNYDGLIFKIGDDRQSSSQLQDANNKQFEIANYSYSVGSGNDSKITHFGYIMIDLDRNLPNIVLDAIKNNTDSIFGINRGNLPIALKNNQKLSLEGDFDKYFSLYVPKGYEEDALYIFSPDLMSIFIDELSESYDAEIVDNKLFIYSNLTFDLSDPILLKKLFKIIDVVGSKMIRNTEHYTDDNVAIVNSTGDILSRRSKISDKSKKLIFYIVFISYIVAFFSFLFIFMINQLRV